MAQTDGPPAYSLPIHAAEQLRAAGRELALAGDHEAALAKYTEAAAAFARAGFAKGVGVCLTNRAIVAGKLLLPREPPDGDDEDDGGESTQQRRRPPPPTSVWRQLRDACAS